MIELRKDYILNRWVIISEGRAKRPKQFHKQHIVEDDKICYFCPGNEKLTPKEIGRAEFKNKWIVRWFPNKFPFVKKEGSPKIKNGFLTHGNSYGYHEVIVENPDHSKQLADLSIENIFEVLKVYSLRTDELSKIKDILYVQIFKNHGAEGGTSLVHTHTQVAAYNMIPPLIEEEVNCSIKNKKCLYCDIIKKESKSERRIFETKNFASFAPYSSRFNYEAWIFPKKHLKSITKMNDDLLKELAGILKKILVKIKEIDASYNYFLHYAPQGKDLHFHIEITPRIATWAGFELSTNTIVNSVSPEYAARFYRAEKKLTRLEPLFSSY